MVERRRFLRGYRLTWSPGRAPAPGRAGANLARDEFEELAYFHGNDRGIVYERGNYPRIRLPELADVLFAESRLEPCDLLNCCRTALEANTIAG
jgi:hypothetical protein